MEARNVSTGQRGAEDSSGALLTARDVRKSFRAGPIWRRKAVPVLSGASLEVARGALVGLVGENGSGKSTMMKIIVGMLGADGGEVLRPATFGYCPQQPMLWDKLTVDEHFALFAAAYGLDDLEREAAATRLLSELNFAKYRSARVETLSGGTRQKLNLSLAMMHEPQVLLLDEPYSGFDWETYEKFWEMSETRRTQGMGILVISHLLTERERFDQIYELKSGRCIVS